MPAFDNLYKNTTELFTHKYVLNTFMDPGSKVHDVTNDSFNKFLDVITNESMYSLNDTEILDKEIFNDVNYICFDEEKECYYRNIDSSNINLLLLFELFNGTYIQNYFVNITELHFI
jgi:hypothetical protein